MSDLRAAVGDELPFSAQRLRDDMMLAAADARRPIRVTKVGEYNGRSTWRHCWQDDAGAFHLVVGSSAHSQTAVETILDHDAARVERVGDALTLVLR